MYEKSYNVKEMKSALVSSDGRIKDIRHYVIEESLKDFYDVNFASKVNSISINEINGNYEVKIAFE
jgi:hypothetical protein